MRDELITYLKTLSLGTISISEELPWSKDGLPLYYNNFKRIYVDKPQLTQEPAFNTFDGGNYVNQTTSITAYLVVDAKNQPSNLAAIVSLMQGAKNEVTTDRLIGRTCSVNQTFENDALLTEFAYNFTELLTS